MMMPTAFCAFPPIDPGTIASPELPAATDFGLCAMPNRGGRPWSDVARLLADFELIFVRSAFPSIAHKLGYVHEFQYAKHVAAFVAVDSPAAIAAMYSGVRVGLCGRAYLAGAVSAGGRSLCLLYAARWNKQSRRSRRREADRMFARYRRWQSRTDARHTEVNQSMRSS